MKSGHYLTSVNGASNTWDNNGMISAATNTTPSTGSDTYEFSYDAQGNRVGQADHGNWTYYDLDLNAGLTTVLTAQGEDYFYGLGSTPLAQNDPWEN